MAVKLKSNVLARNLVKKTKLAVHIDKRLGQGDFEWDYHYEPKVHDDAWHPSGHCLPSLHELYHTAKSTTSEQHGPSLMKTFQVGHFWHQYLQWVISRELEFCTPEQIERRGEKRWGEGAYHWVVGTGDIAPAILPDGEEYLIDFKTMNSFDFKQANLHHRLADKWECQVNIYMDLFDLDKAILMGILKDSPHDLKEFEFERNPELCEAIYQKWEIVSQCLDEDIEPPEDEEIPLPLAGPVRSA